MQTQPTNRIHETNGATIRTRKQSTFLQLAGTRTRQRPIRVSFPIRRREECMTRRSMLAAMRDAEFHEWLTTGDDFLDAMHHPLR